MYRRACSRRRSFQRARWRSFTLEDARLDRVEPAVVALEVVGVLRRLAVVAEHPARLGELVVVGGDGARLAAGAEVLRGVEAERGGAAHGAGPAPRALPLREVLGPVGLAGVLDDRELVLRCQLEDRIHVGHLPVEMDGDDRGHRAAACAGSRAGPSAGRGGTGARDTPAASPDPWCTWARRCRRSRSRAPACEMASVVAMNVSGTVTTVSPGRTPAAISAKRRASVPLPTATQRPRRRRNRRSPARTPRPGDRPRSSRCRGASVEDRHQLVPQRPVGRDEVDERDADPCHRS